MLLTPTKWSNPVSIHIPCARILSMLDHIPALFFPPASIHGGNPVGYSRVASLGLSRCPSTGDDAFFGALDINFPQEQSSYRCRVFSIPMTVETKVEQDAERSPKKQLPEELFSIEGGRERSSLE